MATEGEQADVTQTSLFSEFFGFKCSPESKYTMSGRKFLCCVQRTSSALVEGWFPREQWG